MAKKYTMLDDLRRSGLTSADAKKLQFKPLTKTATRQLVKKSLEAYQIPYFSVSGRVLDFYRVRFLESSSSFSGAVRKPQRYTQPVKTEPHLYLPPTQDWKLISESIDIPIIFTEGEKKAAKTCKVGYPCIGLGGVWSFRTQTQLPLLDEFEQFQWAGREVSIIYDSDLVTNPAVQKAMQVFAHNLSQLGALVHIGYVPESEGGDKQGLDDYLVSGESIESIHLEAYAEAVSLWEMNHKIAFIKNPGQFYQFSTGLFFSTHQIITTVYPHKFFQVEINEEQKFLPTAKEWIKWSNRRTHKCLTYAPGQLEVLPDSSLNTWKGWGCTPAKGSIKPFMALMKYLFSNDPEMMSWFLQWLAYPIQNPGEKMYTAMVLWSSAQGTGKTLVGYIMGKIYGDNFREIDEEQLHDKHNDWALHRQFVLGDELVGSDKRQDSARLKSMITRNNVSVNIKFQPRVVYQDCCNYLFTSQHPDAFFLEDQDRRYAIHEVIGKAMPDKFYQEIDAWKEGSGPSHLFYHLLNEVSCKGFNPKSHAPSSLSKLDMINLSKSDIDMFVQILKEDPDQVLSNGKYKLDRDLFTAQEIVDMYDPDGLKRTAVIAMSKALSRAGFRQLPVTRTASGAKRLWPVRNRGRWARSESFERIENYDKSVVNFNKAKEKYLKSKKEENK